MNSFIPFRGPAGMLAAATKAHPFIAPDDPGSLPDPVATHSVHDCDIGDIVGRTPAVPCKHLRVVSHQSVETDYAEAILRAAVPGAPLDGSLRVVGDHPEEGLVAMGVEGRLLHIVQLADR